MQINPTIAERLAANLLTDTPERPDGSSGSRIGRYRIAAPIGIGGMGTVYRAHDAQTNREVALKLIRPELLSPESRRRFAHETRVLGRLQHPGIAQIYEAGEADTDHGTLPYFAMELVEGNSIHEFADVAPLSTQARLELFLLVCEAVEHAHQKGVIHRDLKPANIIVDASGRPRILDFGIARLTDSDVQVTTMQTDIGKLIGTIPYMSPEQAGGNPDDVDTRSDVYALGVILYRLLAGRLPYTLDNLPIPDAVRVVRETDPTPLSSINRIFRGDLETIVAKALAKEKDRRYQTVTALASDIRRYLNNEPIEARPTSVAYQLRKLARRNRGAAVGIVGLAAGLIAMIAGVSYAALAAAKSRDEALLGASKQSHMLEQLQRHVEQVESAERAARSSEESFSTTTQFLTQMLFSLTPEEARGKPPMLVDALDLFAQRELSDPADNPRAQASIDAILAETYRRLGRFKDAELFFERAAANPAFHLPEHRESRLSMLNNQAVLYSATDRGDEATRQHRQVLQERAQLLGLNHEDTITSMANLASTLERPEDAVEAEDLYRQAVAGRARLLGPRNERTLRTTLNFAMNLRRQGKIDDFERLAMQVFSDAEQTLGPDHPLFNDAVIALGHALRDQERWWEAVSMYQRSLDGAIALHGETSREAANARFYLAWAFSGIERRDLAIEQYEMILSKTENLDKSLRARTLGSCAVFLMQQNRNQEAERYLCESLDIQISTIGERHPNTIASMNSLSSLYRSTGRLDDAIEMSRRAIAIVEVDWPSNHRLIGQVHGGLGRCYMAAKQFDDAKIHLERAAVEFAKLKDAHSFHAAAAKDLEQLRQLMKEHSNTSSKERQ